jgi:hypothetical protein
MGGAQHLEVLLGERGGEGPAEAVRVAGAAAPAPPQPGLDQRLPSPDRPEQAQDRGQEPRLRAGGQGKELVRTKTSSILF